MGSKSPKVGHGSLSYTCAGLDDLRVVARTLAESLEGGHTLGLIGPLGAGKTTFVRFLAEALGSIEAVSSPTYVLCHHYHYEGGRLEHWDLYRLAQAPVELFEPTGQDEIRVIEWVDKFSEITQLCNSVLELNIISAQSRSVHLCLTSSPDSNP